MKVPNEGKAYYSLFLTLVLAIIAAAVAWGAAQNQIADTRTRVDNLEIHERDNTQRLTRIEDGVQAIKERLAK